MLRMSECADGRRGAKIRVWRRYQWDGEPVGRLGQSRRVLRPVTFSQGGGGISVQPLPLFMDFVL